VLDDAFGGDYLGCGRAESVRTAQARRSIALAIVGGLQGFQRRPEAVRMAGSRWYNVDAVEIQAGALSMDVVVQLVR